MPNAPWGGNYRNMCTLADYRTIRHSSLDCACRCLRHRRAGMPTRRNCLTSLHATSPSASALPPTMCMASQGRTWLQSCSTPSPAHPSLPPSSCPSWWRNCHLVSGIACPFLHGICTLLQHVACPIKLHLHVHVGVIHCSCSCN